jgi:hypothetical protein
VATSVLLRYVHQSHARAGVCSRTNGSSSSRIGSSVGANSSVEFWSRVVAALEWAIGWR